MDVLPISPFMPKAHAKRLLAIKQAKSAESDDKIKDFHTFFRKAQRFGFFHTDDSHKPFNLYPQQVSWYSSLFVNNPPLHDKVSINGLLASRRKGKTDICTAALAFEIYKNPLFTAGICCREGIRANDIVETVRNILTSFGVSCGNRRGYIKTPENKSKEYNLFGTSISKANLRGKHLNLMIFDDALTYADYYSAANQRKALNVYEEAQSIARRIIVVGQLISLNDFHYTHIKLGSLSGDVNLIESWYGDIPELDPDLNAIRTTMSESSVSRNYLGVFAGSDERIFSNIEIVDSSPSGRVVYCIDPAKKSGEDSDATTLAFGWRDDGRGRIVIHGYTWPHTSWDDCIDDIADIINSFGTSARGYYEENSSGTILGKTLKMLTGRKPSGFATKSNKTVRISRHKAAANLGLIALSANADPDFNRAVIDYTDLSPHDDEADVLDMVITALEGGYNDRHR